MVSSLEPCCIVGLKVAAICVIGITMHSHGLSNASIKCIQNYGTVIVSEDKKLRLRKKWS